MTPSCEAEKEDQRYFNSPPHKKNHIATTMINTVFFKISTHILTKRMTIIHSFAAPAIYISTHILTKRMTDGFPTFCILCVISTHILTKRMTWKCKVSVIIRSISTHILTKRMTIVMSALRIGVIFQLTSSRRGWRCCYCCVFRRKSISTHILTKRMTATGYWIRYWFPVFQLTSSRRGWQPQSLCHHIQAYFNSHLHEEDDDDEDDDWEI